MEVKIFGEKYLMMDNYDSITIESPEEIKRFRQYDGYGAFIASGSSVQLSEDKININIENSKQEEIVSLLSSDIESNIQSNWKFLSNLSEYDKIEEVVSYFLKNNTIDAIYHKMGKSKYPYDFSVGSSEQGKKLTIKTSNIFNIDKMVNLKYKKDCLQFLENNKRKKYYCYVANRKPHISYYGIYPSHVVRNMVLPYGNVQRLWNTEEIIKEVVLVADHITDKIDLFEARLNQEQEKASLELIDASENVFKVICNDCIFILSGRTYLVEELGFKLTDIIENHNQSIEKGRQLLMSLEEGNRELWLKWE